MAVFTAIATAIVGAFATAGTILGSTLLFNIAVGVVATGLAAGTAKLLGVFDPPGSTGKDPGVKIQLAPSTDNKVARFYGRNYTGGPIIDAEIKNENKTMAYCIVISEYNDLDVWTVNNIYRGDGLLNFSGATVTSITDPNATASTKINGLMRVRVYAGGSDASHQIFPTTGAVNAYGGTSTSKSGQFQNWTSANTMEDLVFAVIEIDYEPEEGLTGLGAITFDIENSVTNPSDVLKDYLTNDRYGAGLSTADLDIPALNDYFLFCNEAVNYTTAGNVTAQHNRYQIDGVLSTFDTAKRNIEKICLSGGAFFTFSGKTGKFSVVPNRAATVAEQANAFVLNDDNIVSSITITSTELFSLFNEIEVEYPSVNQKDQTDVYHANVDVSLLNPNEPTNTLSYRLDMCNDRARVSNLANIDLNQNRLNTILECSTDFTGMQMDVGDVVKVTSALYGYGNKLFRVMRLSEIEDGEGMIKVKCVLLEYDDDVYGDLLTQEDLPVNEPGIGNWWVENSNASLTLGNITIVNDPLAANANIHDPVTGLVVGTEPLANVRNEFGSTYTGGTFINVPIDVPSNTTFSEAKVVCINETATTAAPVTFRQTPGSNTQSYFNSGETFNFPIDTFTFNRDTQFRMEVSLHDQISGSESRRFTTGSFQVSRANVIEVPDIQPGAAGLHFAEILPAYRLANANVTAIPTGTAANLDIVKIVDDSYDVGIATIGTPDTVETFPENIGLWSFSGECFFTGEKATTFASAAYQVESYVTYLGNVAADNNLVLGTDYQTEATLVAGTDDRIPIYLEFTIGGDLYSTLAYRAGREYLDQFSISPFNITIGFTIYNKAVTLNVNHSGASSVQNLNDYGERGFKLTYELTKANKGDLVPFRTEYLAQE
jgi:hypothetical protein